MKKLFILIVVLVFALVACGTENIPTSPENDTVQQVDSPPVENYDAGKIYVRVHNKTHEYVVDA